MDNVDNEHLRFHASGIFSLNDPTEFIYGYSILMKYLPKIEKELSVKESHQLSKLWDKDKSLTHEEWNTIHLNMIEKRLLYPFIISFSKNRESLPMWRMYGDNGRGIALGFDLRMYVIKKKKQNGIQLLDFTHIDLEKAYSVDVEYGDISQIKYPYIIAKYRYKEYLKDIERATNPELIAKKQIDAIATIMLSAAPYIKHNAYADEMESRLISYCGNINDVKYKCNRSGKITPYIEITIPKKDLKEVIIGPCNDYNSIKDSVNIIMLQKEFKEFEITQSHIPYRI